MEKLKLEISVDRKTGRVEFKTNVSPSDKITRAVWMIKILQQCIDQVAKDIPNVQETELKCGMFRDHMGHEIDP